MTDAFPPKSYEDLIRVIHDRYDAMSKTYQKIAVYLTQNPNDVAVTSVNAIGEKTGIHASSFVRYAQSLGFAGFKELQAVFQRRLTTAAPGFDARIRALEDELGEKEDRSDLGFLRDLVVRDLSSLQDLAGQHLCRADRNGGRYDGGGGYDLSAGPACARPRWRTCCAIC